MLIHLLRPNKEEVRYEDTKEGNACSEEAASTHNFGTKSAKIS
jgi:hypothetical protein